MRRNRFSLGFAPTVANRNSAIELFNKEQRRATAAINCLIANAPEARAANPDLYENLITQANALIGQHGPYFEQILYTATEDTLMQTALIGYTSEVESFVARVQQIAPCMGAIIDNPLPQVDDSLPQPQLPVDAPPVVPVTPVSPPPPTPLVVLPLRPVSKLPTKYTWTFYAWAGGGVLLGVSLLGLLFLGRRRKNRKNRKNRKKAR
jgi:hypothetical protein